jgi:modulator of FtsH protease
MLAMSIQDWDNFGQVVGSASGALVGLLFVAVSLNRDRIAQHPSLRASATQTLVLFMLPLIISILLVTPRQPSWVLGAELITLGVIAGLVLAIVGRGKRTTDNSRFARLLDHVSPNLLSTLLILVAGVTLVAGHGDGLYWLVPAVTFELIGGAVNAWLFLIQDPD